MGTTRQVVACAMVFIACACGTGDTKIDPGDLELRDLLGVSPEVAASWDSDQRASARRVLTEELEQADDADTLPAGELIRSLAALDARRSADGDNALGLVAIEGDAVTEHAAPNAPTAADLLAALATDAGHQTGKLQIVEQPRLAVIAAYADGKLVVNSVVLAAFETSVVTEVARTTGGLSTVPTARVVAANGNPYSFYGSVAECAYAQRLRCDSNTSTECTTLAANDGRGFFLLCINLALSITSVDECTAGATPSCPRVTDAASDLSRLEANANFLSDASCASGLDGCLAKIYGPPPGTFPGIIDGGVSPPPTDPPRETNISCGESCDDDKNSNCEASPSCDCSGPSCNNSLSCDSTCASSDSQSGCGGACDSCESDDGGSTGGGGCGGDSGGGSSGGGGGGCGGCSDSGGSSEGSSGGGGCSGGGCSGGGCSGGGSSGGSSCGGGGGGCQTVRRDPSPVFAVALSLTWALLPIPLAAAIRRRSRKRSSDKGETL